LLALFGNSNVDFDIESSVHGTEIEMLSWYYFDNLSSYPQIRN